MSWLLDSYTGILTNYSTKPSSCGFWAQIFLNHPHHEQLCFTWLNMVVVKTKLSLVVDAQGQIFWIQIFGTPGPLELFHQYPERQEGRVHPSMCGLIFPKVRFTFGRVWTDLFGSSFRHACLAVVWVAFSPNDSNDPDDVKHITQTIW